MGKVVTTGYLDKKLNESFNGFSIKLFKYLSERFDQVNKRINALDEKYDRLMATLDAFIKRLNAHVCARTQPARMERWIEPIAKKTGEKLE